MSTRANEALIALRQIQRKTELASKRLASLTNLSPSQLWVMEVLKDEQEVSLSELVAKTQLKNATITALVDKLVDRKLVLRRKCDEDRRRVWIRLTPEGETMFDEAPDLLQTVFEDRFLDLPDWHQSMLISALERVVSLLDAESVDAAPLLQPGPVQSD
jgi:DNA-binding MarR family transcriptional regulator